MSGHLPRWIFLKLLGITLIVACVSFWTQAHGLVGRGRHRAGRAEGLARLGVWLDEQGRSRLAAPTLGWWGPGTPPHPALPARHGGRGFAGGGHRATAGPGPGCGYLSLFHLGEPFLGYQWGHPAHRDAAGRDPVCARRPPPEAGAGAAAAPGGPLGPSALLFQAHPSSGVVKLTSGDPTWADGTALDYHYWTQPLPHGGLAAPGAGLDAGDRRDRDVRVELVAPLLILADGAGGGWACSERSAVTLVLEDGGHLGLEALSWLAAWRCCWTSGLAAAAAGQRGPAADRSRSRGGGHRRAHDLDQRHGQLRLLPALTPGALCVPLLDDAALRWSAPPAAPGGPRRGCPSPSPWSSCRCRPCSSPGWQVAPRSTPRWWEAGEATLAQRGLAWLAEARGAAREAVGAFASANGYGPFATMTRDRFEIVEGSADGVSDWRPYRFRPGDPAQVGAMAGLHMPRLDWQLWFAALRPQCQRGWYLAFVRRAAGLEGGARAAGGRPLPGASTAGHPLPAGALHLHRPGEQRARALLEHRRRRLVLAPL
ncbi:MAG: lipase maturation factor family protein [bacterium]